MILSGVYIVNSAVLPLYNRAVTVNITATGEQNPKALGNNVRLSDIKVNGQELNLGKLEYTAESTWKYDSANDFLCRYRLEGSAGQMHDEHLGISGRTRCSMADHILDRAFTDSRNH